MSILNYIKNRFLKVKPYKSTKNITNEKTVMNGVEYERNDGFNKAMLVPANPDNFAYMVNLAEFSVEPSDEPFYIRRLLLKDKYVTLSQQEKQILMQYYRDKERQKDKDNRYILNETYKLGKKVLGAGFKPTQVEKSNTL
ncbi:MAG: hypothetical protein V7L23_01470 [Nostoc sp.]|uniref:hypothetical protein n=1 Tax=Nostoc sp. TaxID=1180 RepID=UPI002FEF0E8F